MFAIKGEHFLIYHGSESVKRSAWEHGWARAVDRQRQTMRNWDLFRSVDRDND